jgi:hypothetical protein
VSRIYLEKGKSDEPFFEVVIENKLYSLFQEKKPQDPASGIVGPHSITLMPVMGFPQ